MSGYSFHDCFHKYKPLLRQGVSGFTQLLRMICITGPWQLLTKGVSRKCATFMILMCIPSLVVCATLTLPGWVFQSPHQQAYYYFSLMLGQEPLRWLAYGLGACCTLFSLALPGTMDRN
ncbi:MAG: hypothetical protein K9N23_15000 [Akkermansiaceae bacterium]|nr:hypothetical protein [Akkermansiaceae bacterium]MCF7732994.1 hypothetical protein [Akkermansiaceae bacterium]